MKIPIEQIIPSPEPVRTQMEPAKLDELSASIKEQGLIVPIKVRPIDDKYEIVYGHRRFAAAKMASLTEIECYVEGIDDLKAILQAGIENVHREDMNPIDEAKWFQTIQLETGWSSAEISRQLGIHSTHIGRRLLLLEESSAVQDKLRSPRPTITPEHIAEVRQSGVSEVEKKKLIDKIEQEGLTRDQTRVVAKSVSVAQDPRTRERLIATKYNEYDHNPIEVESRAKRFGAHDPLEGEKTSPATNWANLPEVGRVLKALSQAEQMGESIIEMIQQGKFSPEAIPFTVNKIKKMIAVWQNVIKEMEG